MSILEILNEVASDSGKIRKEEILREHSDNELLKRVLYMAYSPSLIYYIKKIPTYTEDFDTPIELEEALDYLQRIADREITGNASIELLKNVLCSLKSDDAEVLVRVVSRDLRGGFSDNTINKVFPQLIEQTPYMGAVGFDEKKARKLFENGGKCESDVKMDGRYVNIIINGSKFDMVSRQGKNSFIPSDFLKYDAFTVNSNLNKYTYLDNKFESKTDMVLNGEIMMDGVSRYEANGIIASIIKITEKWQSGVDITRECVKFEKKHNMTYNNAVDKVYVTVWDFLPYSLYVNGETWEVPRTVRLDAIAKAIEGIESNTIRLVEHKIVETYEEAIAHFSEMVARGEEGTILKSLKGFWEDKKPVHQIKMKLEMTVDMVIKGFNEGNGKYEGMLGSLVCESADGLVKADPFAFSDTQRKEIWENKDEYLNTIVEVKCNGLSNDRDGNYSLLHPVFKSFRDDTDADDLQSIKDIQDMVLGLK